jgi:tetratricopeptide (TPR) repeat protein
VPPSDVIQGQEAALKDEARLELNRLEEAINHSTAEGNTYVAAALHFRAAQICLSRLDRRDLAVREEALTHLWASWQLQPEDLDIRTVLGHHLERDEQLEEAAGLFASTAEHISDDRERARLLFRAAELLGRADDLPEALRTLRQLDPLDDPELCRQRSRLVRTLLSRPGNVEPDVRIEALKLLVDDLDGDKRFDSAVELGNTLDEAGRAEEAQQCYREALGARPADPAALEPVREALEHEGHVEELVEVLEQAARNAPLGRQLPLMRELAALAETELADLSRTARYLWKAWELAPGNLDEPSHLKRIYTELGQWHSYRRVLEREVLQAKDTDEKVVAYRELARLQQEVFEDHLAAARTYGYILHLAPDDRRALESRVEIFRRLKMDNELTLALRRFIAHTRVPGLRDELSRHLARLEVRLPDMGYLARTLRQVSPSDEKNRALVREIRQLPSVRGRPLDRDLGMLLLKMELAANADPEPCAQLALELAHESLEAGELGRAVECFRQTLALDEDNEEARHSLEELSRRGEPRDTTAAELIERASELQEYHPERAVRLFVQAAGLLGGDAPQVEKLLRRAMETCPADAVTELQLLEEAIRSAQMFEDLAQLLEMQAAADQPPARRKDTIRALAKLYREELENPERALKVLNRVLEIDPLDTEVIQEVRALHTELGNHEALAKVLEELLLQAAGQERISLLSELGRLYSGPLDDQSSALSRYAELLALVPDDADALSFCRAHDEATGNYRSVAVMLCRAAEATDDLLGRAETHRQIARIAEERLADPEFAITHWRTVVELCPADSAPRAELKRLLAQVGRWNDLERVLLSEVSRSLRPEEKVPIYFELARIACDELQDDRRAASYLRNALQLAPDNHQALEQLETIYERLGQWRELAAVLRRHADAVESDLGEKVALLHRAARVLFVHLGRDEEALTICRLVREMAPVDRGAATLMGEILGKRGKWGEKASLLRDQIAKENDPPELGRLHLELGRLLLDKQQDNEAAASHFELALELSSGAAEILPLLRQLYESLGRWDLLVELIRRRATAESIPANERALALCEIGRIKDEHLGDTQGAKEAYEQALHLDPSHRQTLLALRNLSSTAENWKDLVALARRELTLTEDDAERARLLVEIGEIQFSRLGRPNAAAEALEQALEHDPGNSKAAELLGAIYFETEDWERAGQLLEKVVNSGLELDNLHEYYYQLGYANEQLGREDDAFSHYVKSFGREPMFLPTLTRLVTLCYARNQWENTLRIGEAIVTTYADQKTPEELAELYVLVGLSELHLAQRDVAVKQLQKLILAHGEVPSAPTDAWVDAAEPWAATPLEPRLLGQVDAEVLGSVIKAMERALSHISNHAGALQVLAALSLSRRDWERCLRYIERAVEVIDVPRFQVALLVCAGDVAHKHLLSAPRARDYYQRALQILPGSELARDRLDMVEVTPARGTPIPTRIGRGRLKTPPPLPPPTPPVPPAPKSKPKPPMSQTQTKPLPGLMPPLPDDVAEEAPAVTPRPAPRSRPRPPDEE